MKYNKHFLVEYAKKFAEADEADQRKEQFKPSCLFCPLSEYCDACNGDMTCEEVIKSYYDMIEKELDDLESRRFMLSMKDHWNTEDYDRDRELFQKIMEYKKKLGKE